MLALAVAVWSAMTALCGMAVNFTMLFAARVGMAIGEAGGSPPSHSLISDYFPESPRAARRFPSLRWRCPSAPARRRDWRLGQCELRLALRRS